MAGRDTVTFTRTEEYSSHMAEELKNMREERQFTDFNIKVNEESLPCHRVVVAAHSPYLKALLATDMAEAAKQSVSLDHINTKAMQVILNYMYLGQIFFHISLLMDMVIACDYLQMELLTDMCVDQVPAVLKPDTVISWLKLAHKLNLAELKAKCTALMASSFAEVSKLPDFPTLTYAEVQESISDVMKADADRDEVLQAVMRWVNYDADQRRQHLENLLHQVELTECTYSVIVDVMETFGALIVACKVNVLNLLTKAMKQAASQRGMDQLSKSKIQKVLVIIGGRIGDEVNRVCWKLNNAKQFVKFCKIPFVEFKRWHSICATPHGFVITGGENSKLCIMFHALTKTWSQLQDMLTVRDGHGSICFRGVLYVVGGRCKSFDDSSKSVNTMDINSGIWQTESDLLIAVRWPNVIEVNDSVYLMDTKDTNQLLKLDMKKKAWIRRAQLPVDGPCNDTSICRTRNGQLCVAGGGKKICAMYNPTTDTWTMTQGPSQSHYGGPLVSSDTTLMLLGGFCEAEGSSEIEEYNMDDGSWSTSSLQMPADLVLHRALMLNAPHTTA